MRAIKLSPDEIDLNLSTDGRPDFSTVDWITEKESHRRKAHRDMVQDQRHPLSWIFCCWDSVKVWFLLFLVGILTAVLAVMIDIATEWAYDLRFGYCTGRLYANRMMCCAKSFDVEGCEDWILWGSGDRESGRGTDWYLGLPGWGNYIFFSLWSVGMAGLSAFFVVRFSPYAAGSGVPELKTILGGFIIRRFLGMWCLLVKCVSLSLSVGSGLFLGKEGPLVHVASCCANVLSRLIPSIGRDPIKKRELLSAAAAAGVAAAFGAPIGGVLFSFEEVSTIFPARTLYHAFFCGCVSALVLQRLDPFGRGRLTLFAINYSHQWHYFELPLFLVIGVAGGAVGALFIMFNEKICRLRNAGEISKTPISEACVLALLTALVCFPFQFLRIQSGQLIALLFNECEHMGNFQAHDSLCRDDEAVATVIKLTVAMLVHFILSVFTFGIRVPAGLFIPSLATGACMGRVVGTLMRVAYKANPTHPLFGQCVGEVTPCITPGIYAMVGAAAVLSGVTRMTVSLVVIVLELTGGMKYIVPVMVSVMFAKWTADALCPLGIYNVHIMLKGYPFLEPCAETVLPPWASADDVMSGGMSVLPLGPVPASSVHVLLSQTSFSGFPVVRSPQDSLPIGYVRRDVLQSAMHHAMSLSPARGPGSRAKVLFTFRTSNAIDSAGPSKSSIVTDVLRLRRAKSPARVQSGSHGLEESVSESKAIGRQPLLASSVDAPTCESESKSGVGHCERTEGDVDGDGAERRKHGRMGGFRGEGEKKCPVFNSAFEDMCELDEMSENGVIKTATLARDRQDLPTSAELTPVAAFAIPEPVPSPACTSVGQSSQDALLATESSDCNDALEVTEETSREVVTINLSHAVERNVVQVPPTMPFTTLLSMFSSLGLRYVFVTDVGELVGIIKKKDVVAYSNYIHYRAQAEKRQQRERRSATRGSGTSWTFRRLVSSPSETAIEMASFGDDEASKWI